MAVFGTKPVYSYIGLCYQEANGGPLNIFAKENYIEVQVSSTMIPYSVSASVVPGAGTWNVGFCIHNQSFDIAIENFDWVNGWVMVTN